ncbi:MAG: hypothetical protein C4547_12405 [Phycisphaerales bacterium]|nr:MAG: hypothetical protein C4547_12405 [Phycisphaerales bacterium]
MPPIAHAVAGLLTFALAFSLVGYFRHKSDPGYTDDGWIHLTFARNLAETGRLTYGDGVWTPGSTAPLWTVLLAAGFFVGTNETWWPWMVDALCLGLAGLAAVWLLASVARHRPCADGVRCEAASGRPRSVEVHPWASFALRWCCAATLVSSGPLVWSAAGAMEVPLTIALILAAVALFQHHSGRPRRAAAAWGACAGLAALCRPECLIVAIILGGLECSRGREHRFVRTLPGWGACALVYSPSVILGLAATGLPFPNTFYAKATALVEGAPDPAFIAGALAVFRDVAPHAGGLFVLGGAMVLAGVGRGRVPLGMIACAAFAIALPLAYASMGRTAHFVGLAGVGGRYLFPMIGPMLVVGFWGVEALMTRVVRRGLRLCIGAVVILAVAAPAGDLPAIARTFAHQVWDTQVMQVAMADFLRDRLLDDATVAANDVGALGFRTSFRVVDLVGLVSNDVMAALRAARGQGRQPEAALMDVLRLRRPDALLIFPRWYPDLLRELEPGLEFMGKIHNEQNITSADALMVAYRIDWEKIGSNAVME